jgi:hypothetical protein
MSQELRQRIENLESREMERERNRLRSEYQLPAEIAGLIQGGSLAEMENHARELANAIRPVTAPPTENGAQPSAIDGKSQETKNRHYSFNVPGSVEW